MFELLALFLAGAACVAVVAITALAFKVVFHVAFFAVKLLFLPFILIAVLIKITLLAALVVTVLTFVIPVLLVLAIVAAPFVLLGALS